MREHIGHHVVHQADRAGAFRIDGRAGQRELARDPRTDDRR